MSSDGAIATVSQDLPALVFDLGCGGCCYVIDRLLDTARLAQVTPIALQSARSDLLLAPLDARTRDQSWHFVGSDGTITSGADVAVSLAAYGQGNRAMVSLLRWSMPIARPLYRLMAANRMVWSRLLPQPWRSAARERLVAKLAEEGDVPVVAHSCALR